MSFLKLFFFFFLAEVTPTQAASVLQFCSFLSFCSHPVIQQYLHVYTSLLLMRLEEKYVFVFFPDVYQNKSKTFDKRFQNEMLHHKDWHLNRDFSGLANVIFRSNMLSQSPFLFLTSFPLLYFPFFSPSHSCWTQACTQASIS